MSNLREEKIKALRKARELMGANTNLFCICYALDRARQIDPRLGPAVSSLFSYIQRSLSPSVFLSGWIAKHRPDLPRGPNAMFKYRIQWIDWMIDSLEKQK